MLETVRDFAAARSKRATASPPEQVTPPTTPPWPHRSPISRHVATAGWIQVGDRELGNLRAAMSWAFANGQSRLGMAMATDLWPYFCEQATGSNENVRWGRLALELIDEDDDDVMLVAAGTLIEAYNLGDVVAMEVVAERVRRGLRFGAHHGRQIPPPGRTRGVGRGDRPAVGDDLRRGGVVGGPAADRAHAHPRQPDRTVMARRHAQDGPSTMRRLHETLATMSHRPTLALKIEAGVAACAGRWDEVLRLTEQPVADKVRNDLDILRIEALAALGRFDEASRWPANLRSNDYWADSQRVHLIGAAIELARGDPPAALRSAATRFRS